MRVKHYIKNLLVILPLIFSGRFFEKGYFITAILGFLSFSMLSSVVYIINDLIDVEKDRNHPDKCKRPIASGVISVRKAVILASGLLILSIFIHFQIIGREYGVNYLFAYLFINVLYSFELKNRPILDVAILVTGFLLRVIYGGKIFDIEVSNWLLLTVISFSFYLSLGKRRNELNIQRNNDTRKVLYFYNNSFLDKNMYMFLALTNVFYALWSAESPEKFMIWTVPIFMIICLRYSLDIEGDSDGDPVEVLIKDRFLLGLSFIYGISITCILYL
jgi:4-hydroxybenzoate polyprenyltransferase